MVLAERIPTRESPVVIVDDARTANMSAACSPSCSVTSCPGMEPESDAVVLVEHRRVRAGHQSHEVGRQGRPLHDPPATEGQPAWWRCRAPSIPGAQTLISTSTSRSGWSKQANQRGAASRTWRTGRSHDPVDRHAGISLRRRREAHLSLDDHRVLRTKVVQRNPAGPPGARVQFDPVEPHRGEAVALEVEEALLADCRMRWWSGT